MAAARAPAHLAIIPDGNRRWARARGLPASKGHERAVREERLLALLDEAARLGVRHLSLWAFSTENWKRAKPEISLLFGLLDGLCGTIAPRLHEREARFRWIGRRDRVPKALRARLEALERETSRHARVELLLCLDYGGRDELARAASAAIAQGLKKVDEKGLARLLDTAGIPDPDMIVRTGGDMRLSGFFPFQGTYAELRFVRKRFPDFSPRDVRAAVEDFARRQRRFGA